MNKKSKQLKKKIDRNFQEIWVILNTSRERFKILNEMQPRFTG